MEIGDSAEIKYLNILIKTISKTGGTTLNSRVNNEKHDYTDWINKNIKDEKLSDKAEQYQKARDKNQRNTQQNQSKKNQAGQSS